MPFFASRGPTRLWQGGLALALVGAGCTALHRPDSLALVVAEPSRVEPVTAAMLAEPRVIRPGETFQLWVRVRIAGGHHIYSTNASSGPFAPTALTLVLPDSLEPAGNWAAPRPVVTKTGESVYTDSVLFRRLLRVRFNARQQPLTINGELQCQACTEELCWPAGRIALSASVAVVTKTKE